MQIFKKVSRSKAGLFGILAALVIIIGVVWASLNYSGKNRIISAVKIIVLPDTGVQFVTQQDVSNLLSEFQSNPVGKSLSQINIAEIENKLKKSPYIETAQVYTSLDGLLKIQIKQRLPILRIVNLAGESFYIDSNGFKMPQKQFYTPDIVVASGNIPEKLNDSNRIHSYALNQLLPIAKLIYYSKVWNAQFEQCYVDNFSDIILVPRVGRHSIVIGSAEKLTEKMENLRIFYEKGLPNTGWEVYSQISLKYAGMIVGVRSGKQIEHKTTEHVQKQQH